MFMTMSIHVIRCKCKW